MTMDDVLSLEEIQRMLREGKVFSQVERSLVAIMDGLIAELDEALLSLDALRAERDEAVERAEHWQDRYAARLNQDISRNDELSDALREAETWIIATVASNHVARGHGKRPSVNCIVSTCVSANALLARIDRALSSSPQPKGEGEPDAQCDYCGHLRSEHEDSGRCNVFGIMTPMGEGPCSCIEWIDPAWEDFIGYDGPDEPLPPSGTPEKEGTE